ncbi:hypothetical protein ONZ45_g6568 [Pleurotus djamor]|nr:hypothetical protein ONZ45_g6568 [Pleurotus djamor]
MKMAASASGGVGWRNMVRVTMEREGGRDVSGYESSGGERTRVEEEEEEKTRRGWRRGKRSESESGSESESSESGYACSSSSFESGSSFECGLSDSESPESSGSEDDDHGRDEGHIGDNEGREGGEGDGGGESGWDEGDMITPKPTDFVPRWFEYRDKGESKGRERVRERRAEREREKDKDKDKERTPRAGFIVPKAYETPTHRSRHKRTHRRSKESNVSLTHHLPPTNTQLHLPHLPHPILSPLGLTSPCASSIDEYPFPLLPDSDVDNIGLRGGRQVRGERQRQMMGRVELREMMIKIQREMYRAERVRLVEKCLRLSVSPKSMDH